tara:strand:- start:140 stop:460 length:321 start_codon:yes stop_codon:yes gene_type:complete
MIIALHISIVLNLIALGLIFWFRKEQQQHNEWFYGETEASEHGYRALMEDFTNYQVKCDRELSKLEKELEIKTKQLERSQTKLVKDLPKDIRKVIGHIEFARPLDK